MDSLHASCMYMLLQGFLAGRTKQQLRLLDVQAVNHCHSMKAVAPTSPVQIPLPSFTNYNFVQPL